MRRMRAVSNVLDRGATWVKASWVVVATADGQIICFG